jgi:CysZ protein
MISSAFRAANDVLSPAFRSVLWKAIGLTLLLFAGLLAAIWVGSSALLTLPWPWLDEVIAAVASIGLLVALVLPDGAGNGHLRRPVSRYGR